ncbi:MAG: zinc dependent phospholipase C family protein [Phycisphaerales bacterium]|nr:zinc dependent phospholipase C family protein [Phycisphaerales bacterium]MCB9863555.1 zinc dependent phospholipase C family protein [Phycisphaerales bacterium]
MEYASSIPHRTSKGNDNVTGAATNARRADRPTFPAPSFRRLIALAVVAVFAVLLTPSHAWAWGPGTHIKLASDLMRNLALLPGGVAALIAAHRRYFQFGNVATDIVLAKKMSRVKQVCHRWSTGFKLLENAESDQARAFCYGYLAHLAADTVAHNKFLPRQMAVSRCTVSFGHFYWEVRADASVREAHWKRLNKLIRDDFHEPERLLETHLKATMLSFHTNRAIFRQVNRLASEKAWQRSVRFWARLSRHDLEDTVLQSYHAESMERIIDVLSRGRESAILHVDPNGNALLAYAKAQRRQLRQLKRAGLSDAELVREAAAGHAPENRALSLHMDH